VGGEEGKKASDKKVKEKKITLTLPTSTFSAGAQNAHSRRQISSLVALLEF